ncbi:MAG: hypothetical protein QM784_21480 [Polyangiaceae bacterium]
MNEAATNRARGRNGAMRGILRVLGLLIVVGGLSSVFVIRHALARAEGEAQRLGRSLLRNLGPLVLGEATSVQVNGSQFFVSATATELEPDVVINRFESFCREHAGLQSSASLELSKLAGGRPLPEALRNPSEWTQFRTEPGDSELSQMACFVRRDRGSLADWLDRVSAFAEDGDLSHLGDMHYVVARRLGPGRTQVLATWSEGRVRLRGMFPAEGDAPGGDLEGIARPPDSQRVLSARLDGRPYSVHMYETRRKPEELLRYYDANFAERGFKPDPVWLETAGDPRVTANPSYARAFTLPRGLLVIAAVEALDESGLTQISLVEMGSRGDAGYVAH